MNCYFDTSALVKLYHEEDGTEVLVNFCDSHADDLIISIAEVTIVELRSAFWRHVRTGELKEHKVRAAFEKVEQDLDEINVVSVGDESIVRAARLLDENANTRKFLSLDALQLGAALVSSHVSPVELFITSDKRLYEVAGNYLHCWDPCEEPVPAL